MCINLMRYQLIPYQNSFLPHQAPPLTQIIAKSNYPKHTMAGTHQRVLTYLSNTITLFTHYILQCLINILNITINISHTTLTATAHTTADKIPSSINSTLNSNPTKNHPLAAAPRSRNQYIGSIHFGDIIIFIKPILGQYTL